MVAVSKRERHRTSLLVMLAVGFLAGCAFTGALQQAAHASRTVTVSEYHATVTARPQQRYPKGGVDAGSLPTDKDTVAAAALSRLNDANGAEQAAPVGISVVKMQTLSQTAVADSKVKGVAGSKLDFVIATGANAGYFNGLKNMVGSVHYWCPECSIVAYNLGLTPQQLQEVDTWCKVTLKWRDGIKLQGPGSEHVMQPKQYAWKPFAILQTVDEYRGKGAVMWIDAGSTITGPLMTSIYPLLTKDGHFLVQGQDLDMTRLIHPNVLTYFKYSKEEFVNKPSFAGNTVGFVHGSEGYHKILRPWVECAGKAECIAPPGATTGNHRFDQTALSIIAYKSGIQIQEHTELLLAERVPCFKPHPRVVWTSRTSESCYASLAVCRANATSYR